MPVLYLWHFFASDDPFLSLPSLVKLQSGVVGRIAWRAFNLFIFNDKFSFFLFESDLVKIPVDKLSVACCINTTKLLLGCYFISGSSIAWQSFFPPSVTT